VLFSVAASVAVFATSEFGFLSLLSGEEDTPDAPEPGRSCPLRKALGLNVALIVGAGMAWWGRPGVLAPLTSKRVTNVAVLIVAILGDVLVAVSVERAGRGFKRNSALVASTFVATCSGLLLTGIFDGLAAVRMCFDATGLFRVLPVGLLFVVSAAGQLMAYNYMGGTVVKILGQLKLPLTVLLSRAILGVSHSTLQWQVIMCIFTACIAFTYLKVDGDLSSPSVAGLPFVGAWIGGNCVASLFAEQALKNEALPFYARVTQQRMSESVAAWAMLFSLSPEAMSSPASFFEGWDWHVILLVVILGIDGWLSAMVVARLSSVHKSIAKTAALVLLACIHTVLGHETMTFAEALAALLVVQCSALFASLPAASGRGHFDVGHSHSNGAPA